MMKDFGTPSPSVVDDVAKLPFKCVLFLRLRAILREKWDSRWPEASPFFHLYYLRARQLPNNILHSSMSRLASFRGPSTPSATPVQSRQPSSPSSPLRLTESTYHRKVRTLLQELRFITQTWDDLVLVDGLKAATGLVDTRTDLE
jgi:hypothetical protein